MSLGLHSETKPIDAHEFTKKEELSPKKNPEGQFEYASDNSNDEENSVLSL